MWHGLALLSYPQTSHFVRYLFACFQCNSLVFWVKRWWCLRSLQRQFVILLLVSGDRNSEHQFVQVLHTGMPSGSSALSCLLCSLPELPALHRGNSCVTYEQECFSCVMAQQGGYQNPLFVGNFWKKSNFCLGLWSIR